MTGSGRVFGRRPRIRRRLAVITAVVTGTVVLAFCIPLAFFVRAIAYDRAIDAAELQARSLAAELVAVRDPAAIRRIAAQANSAASSPATVFLAGARAADARSALPAAVRHGHPATTSAAVGGREVWEPVRSPSAALAVMVPVTAGELSKGVARTWALLFGGGALLLVIAVALADWLGRSIVRPLRALEDLTHRLRDGDLNRRQEPSGPYEVAEVGQAVNELADRINALLASARTAAADLGHRLRTPLTAVRLDAETLTDAAERDRLLASLDTLDESVNRLITEIRQEPGPVSHRADLAEAVRDRMAFWSVLAKSQQRPFEVRAPARRVEISLDRGDLDAAIDALLSNVFAHTSEKTPFSIQLRRTAGAAQSWSLIVEDHGPGARAPQALPGSRRGTGLGLDIVRRTAERAGGTAIIGSGKSGGYRVEIRLPDNAASTAGPTNPADATNDAHQS